MEKSADKYNNSINDIARSIKCTTVRIIKYLNEFDELEKKKLVRCKREDGGISFLVPDYVRDSLRKSNEYMPLKEENLTIQKFFAVLKRLFRERENDELTFSGLLQRLSDLVSSNMHLPFCRKLRGYNLNNDDWPLFLCFCHLEVNYSKSSIDLSDFEFLYDDESEIESMHTFFELRGGTHSLFRKGCIDFVNDNGFADTEFYRLSDKVNKELLFEVKNKNDYTRNLILYRKIKDKKMFYNAKETEEIEKLVSLLKETNFKKIQGRLENKGMRTGFACLFTGSPGTGKTETVYQIARRTKRNIMLVDISSIKSFWFGESEKNMKKIFAIYRSAVENSKAAPILLFNEADAVIAKRRINDGTNHSIDQTENAIQNIILQEMENLEGILIATTNLAQNMDTAFERRFLYKINFEKPNQENRAGIWNSLLPDLPKDRALELSKRFELSGGQIENIARKIEVDNILSGKNAPLDTLIQYCKDEIQNSFNTSIKIGFANE
jgi:adenylate kinase